ncbi:hypothetical protein V7128_12480 [Neobacillus vireti]
MINLATFLVVLVLLVAALLASLLGVDQGPIVAAICSTIGCGM